MRYAIAGTVLKRNMVCYLNSDQQLIPVTSKIRDGPFYWVYPNQQRGKHPINFPKLSKVIIIQMRQARLYLEDKMEKDQVLFWINNQFNFKITKQPTRWDKFQKWVMKYYTKWKKIYQKKQFDKNEAKREMDHQMRQYNLEDHLIPTNIKELELLDDMFENWDSKGEKKS